MRRLQPVLFDQPDFPDYALLDSGHGEKLERFGHVVLRRPDPQALWRPVLETRAWESAHLRFVRESDRGGRWESSADCPRDARGADASWTCKFGGATFLVRPTPFKHVGLFPEQAANWSFVQHCRPQLGAAPTLLNLFGYTGATSVLAAQAGYRVTHVDASKLAISWTLDNAEASGLERSVLRVLCDDALAFARREVRRSKRYAGVLLDPPHYGRGPKGEKWQFEQGISALLEACADLVDARGFIVLSTYAIGYSPLALHNLLLDWPGLAGGVVDVGELALRQSDERRLPAGFCARWSRGLERS